MAYGQTATSEQITLFSQEGQTPIRQKGIPIYRISLVREGIVQGTYGKITTSAMASALLHSYLSDADREIFVVILLDRKNQVIGINTVSIGSLTASIVHPRETFKAAILSNAAAIICGHNHPSGDPQPSQEDRVLTKRLKEVGELLGINLLDHVVLGCNGRYFSFADEGIL